MSSSADRALFAKPSAGPAPKDRLGEKARRLALELGFGLTEYFDAKVVEIRAAFVRVVEEEREACAKTSEEHAMEWANEGICGCAQAIRARGEKP